MSDTHPSGNIPNEWSQHNPIPLPPRYRFEAVLGEGGLGTVVKAYDTHLRTPVAIKTIRHEIASFDQHQYAQLRERFQREAIAGARPLVRSSPHIVTVYDLVVDEAGNAFLVLEYVPGGTLHDYLIGGPLPLAIALRLTADAARGLMALHESDLVHRDIKPENLFLAEDGRAMVGDLGIVQMSTTTFRTRLDYGSPQGHPGTPMYMSPEQALTTNVLMPEVDQYSLGAVLFEMVTGKRYKGIYGREREELLANLPAGVAAVIRRMTAKEAEDRYPGMEAVLRAIQAIDWSETASAPMPQAVHGQWQYDNQEVQWAALPSATPSVCHPLGPPLTDSKPRRNMWWRALAKIGAVIALLFLSLRLMTPLLVVDGSAMLPSLQKGQQILGNSLAYRDIEIGGRKYYLFHQPRRGDIVIFVPPVVPHTPFIDRIIAVPGDTILIHDGKVTVNGATLNEPYISESPRYTYPLDGRTMTLGSDEYFVLGDNRNASEDSHFFGPIHSSAIRGKVLISF